MGVLHTISHAKKGREEYKVGNVGANLFGWREARGKREVDVGKRRFDIRIGTPAIRGEGGARRREGIVQARGRGITGGNADVP